MRTVRLAVVPLLAAAIAACSARSASTNEPGRSGSLIEQSEIRAAQLPNAYDLVERLRPEWLRTAGVRSDHTDGLSIVVYLDNARYGGPESLRQIPAQAVTAIRLLRGSEVNAMLTSMSARGVGSVIHVHTTVQERGGPGHSPHGAL
jgi:hypothetical protein